MVKTEPLATRPFSDLEATAKTGDIILFQGVTHSARLIQMLTGDHWSHVGMIVRSKSDQLLFWESEWIADLDDRGLMKQKTGPQLVDLHERLALNSSLGMTRSFAWRALNTELDEQQHTSLQAFMSEVHQLPFPGPAKFIEDIIEGLLARRASLRTFFCSELVAESYLRLKILEDGRPPNRYWPGDFSHKGKFNHHLRQPYALAPEVQIEL